MEEVVVPDGKQLRYRCSVPNCVSSKTFSIVSIMDHLAIHYAEYKKSKNIFNYYCTLCRIHFYVLGMCAGCKCQAQNPQVSFIQLKPTIKMSDIVLETQFFGYVHKHAVPVFDDIPGFVAKNRPPSNPGTSHPVSTNQEDRHATKSGEPSDSRGAGERRSRSTVRRQPPGGHQNSGSNRRPIPPPIPKRPVSRSPAPRPQSSSHAPKREEEQRSSGASEGRRSRSTYRQPPVKSRQDGLLTDNPPPPSVSRRQLSRSPGPRSRVTSVERQSTNGFSTPRGEASTTMPSPSHYPDGTARSPRYSDDDEMIEPAYFRAVRSRSQSRCGTPAQENGDEGREPARQAAGGNERRASSVWNASLPKPQLFSNIFFQDQFPSSSGSVQQNTPPSTSTGSSPPKKARNGSPDTITEAVQSHPTPPNTEPFPPPPPPETSPVGPAEKPPPPPPLPEEHTSVSSSNGYYKTTVSDPSMRIPPPPPPPAPSSLGVRLSVPSQPATKPAPASSAAPCTSSSVDRGSRKTSAPTVRSTNKRSRQDGLLEENPSPPRSPRPRVSRSPGPRAPVCPSHRKEFGSKTPTHESQSYANGSRTPGYSYQSAVYNSNNASTGARTPAYGSTTPFHAAQTPRYCGGSPDYKNGARTPGYGGRTPNQGSYGACTPGHGGWTPNQGAQTSFYGSQNISNYGARTPNTGPQTPVYESHNSGYGGRSPGPRGPSTPYHVRDSPERGPHTPREGACTPLFDGRSSRSQTEIASVPISSKTQGFNKAYAGHTPMRPPTSYPDGTPRSPRYEDNEEEAVPSYMRSPRYTSCSNEETQPVQPTIVPDSDPLSLSNRARTPPPPDRGAFQQNTPATFPSAPPANGFHAMGQPGMSPFPPAPSQNPFMPPPFGHPPFMFPMPNQFGMFPLPGMPPAGVPPPGMPPPGVPPPLFPNLHVSPSPFAPPQQFFAPTPTPPTSLSNSSSNGPQQSQSPPKSAAAVPPASTSTAEPRTPTTSTASKKSVPPQRIGGSVFLETPPPAPKPAASTSKPRKEPTKRKRRYSYDRSDSD